MDGDRWGPDGPPEEAYSRVSDPARHLGLHAVADGAVARLVGTCSVTAVTLDPASVAGHWRGGVLRATRLTPEGDGAPLTVIWTGFGVALRAGHAFERPFPSCGCDACDEDVDRVAADLVEALAAVAGGGLVESRRPRRLGADDASVELRSPAGSTSSGGRLTEPGDSRHRIPPGRTPWPPWPAR